MRIYRFSCTAYNVGNVALYAVALPTVRRAWQSGSRKGRYWCHTDGLPRERCRILYSSLSLAPLAPPPSSFNPPIVYRLYFVVCRHCLWSGYILVYTYAANIHIAYILKLRPLALLAGMYTLSADDDDTANRHKNIAEVYMLICSHTMFMLCVHAYCRQ